MGLLAALAALAGATLVSEDLTAIGAGLAIRNGSLPALPALVACGLGILGGDIALLMAGRLFFSWPPISRLITRAAGAQLATTGDWIERHTAAAILGSRLIPGARLPLYLAAGASRRATARVIGWMAVAVSVWTPAIVLGTAVVGPTLAGPLERLAVTPWIARVAVAVGLLLALRLTLVFAASGRERLRRAIARARQWEFWPSWLLNAPIVAWVACLSVRYRSLALVTAVNPGIPDGGIVGESKSAILRGIPPAWVMPWTLVAEGPIEARLNHACAAIHDGGWRFPLVAKPDVGERGSNVRWVGNEDDLRRYLARVGGPVILQVAHEGPFEAGIFYVRHPGQANGRIWSLTDKRFPSVVGDGDSTVATLIDRHPRHRLQREVFRERLGLALDFTPQTGEKVALGRAGNHCQGTQFLDGRHLATPQLEARIDEIARAIPGFYFGRFDVRYRDLEAFQAGRDLAILELNGLTSEATHIYDPRYSVWHAWRTLAAQWSLAFDIAAANRARGTAPTPLSRLAATLWDSLLTRPAPAIAD
jgi:membrane protein DedA with SNARE-associated domain